MKRVVMVFLGILLLGMTGILAERMGRLKGEEQGFREISERVQQNRQNCGSSLVCQDEEDDFERSVLPEYQELILENPNFAGWISIADTRIDYPVMHTLGEPEYYLHRDFYGADSYSGTPFIGQGSLDPRSQNVILYGHHMRNGNMFSDLMKYREKEFWESHRFFRFDTLYERQEYEIFAVCYGTGTESADDSLWIYRFINGSDEEYQAYVSRLKETAFYETGIEPDGNPLLLLVTCSYQEADGRFIVAAQQRNPQKQEVESDK